MKEPDSFKPAMQLEFKRFFEALKETGNYILENSGNTQNCTSMHQIVENMISLFYMDYIYSGLGEMLVLYPVSNDHQLKSRDPQIRSPLEMYISSLRSMLISMKKSYFLTGLASAFGLEKFKQSAFFVIQTLLELLKNLETTANWTEKYLSYLEHGAQLQTVFINANKADEEDDDITPAACYSDAKTRVYAILKTTELSPTKFASFIGSLNALLENISVLLELGHQIYTSLAPDEFDNLFKAFASRKLKLKEEDPKNFSLENVKELNEFFRQKMKDSLEEEDGFMYNVTMLFDGAREMYIAKLATEALDLLAFLPGDDEEELFIKRYENGWFWRQDNG